MFTIYYCSCEISAFLKYDAILGEDHHVHVPVKEEGRVAGSCNLEQLLCLMIIVQRISSDVKYVEQQKCLISEIYQMCFGLIEA